MNQNIKRACYDDLPRWNAPASQIPARVKKKTFCSVQDVRIRGRLLGNSVVPACARTAFAVLSDSIIGSGTFPCSTFSNDNKSFHDMTYTFRVPEKYTVGGKKWFQKYDVTSSLWATPQAAERWGWSISRIGSSRALRYLPNQIAYEQGTQDYINKKGFPDIQDWVINPEFIEWMMGYTRQWTAPAVTCN